MSLFDLAITASIKGLGSSGQKQVAKTCHAISENQQKLKNPKHRITEWEDLTEREQKNWMIAVWDVLNDNDKE
jgi:hypothetical protein